MANTIIFNDRLGSRLTRFENLLVAWVGDEQLIFPFAGESIPGVCRVESIRHEGTGKWAYRVWTVILADGIQGFSWHPDWERGTYVAIATWADQFAQVRDAARGIQLTDAAIERYIRASCKDEAARAKIRAMDEAESVLSQRAPLSGILAAQQELAHRDV